MEDTLKQSIGEKEFEQLFKEFFAPLCGFARKFIRDDDSSREIVHDVFINLWNKRDTIDPEKSIKSYLFTSVNNRCLNYIRDHKKFDKTEFIASRHEDLVDLDANEKMVAAENEKRILDIIDALPEKCKEIFKMSRFEELKYAEISERLNISIKTVEAQMSKALKILHEKLAPLMGLILFLLNFKNSIG